MVCQKPDPDLRQQIEQWAIACLLPAYKIIRDRSNSNPRIATAKLTFESVPASSIKVGECIRHNKVAYWIKDKYPKDDKYHLLVLRRFNCPSTTQPTEIRIDRAAPVWREAK